jgi:hypothetical protein
MGSGVTSPIGTVTVSLSDLTSGLTSPSYALVESNHLVTACECENDKQGRQQDDDARNSLNCAGELDDGRYRVSSARQS